MRIRDLMTSTPVTVPPETPLQAVAALMAERGISGVPVVDADGTLLGMITDGDLMRRLAVKEDRPETWLARLLASHAQQADHYARSHGRRVKDVMTTELATVTEDASIEEVAKLLESRRIRRVPVVRDGRLLGIVSRADLVRAVMSEPASEPGDAPDDRIRRRVIAAMREQPWVDTYLVFPIVRDGVVTFHGFCGSEKVIRALRVLAEGVEGVREARFETTPTPALFLGAP